MTALFDGIGNAGSPPANSDRNRSLVILADTMFFIHKKLPAEKLPQRREQLQREIAATDRQTDQLVYQHYGLSDDEIKIVESATF